MSGDFCNICTSKGFQTDSSFSTSVIDIELLKQENSTLLKKCDEQEILIKSMKETALNAKISIEELKRENCSLLQRYRVQENMIAVLVSKLNSVESYFSGLASGNTSRFSSSCYVDEEMPTDYSNIVKDAYSDLSANLQTYIQMNMQNCKRVEQLTKLVLHQQSELECYKEKLSNNEIARGIQERTVTALIINGCRVCLCLKHYMMPESLDHMVDEFLLKYCSESKMVMESVLHSESIPNKPTLVCKEDIDQQSVCSNNFADDEDGDSGSPQTVCSMDYSSQFAILGKSPNSFCLDLENSVKPSYSESLYSGGGDSIVEDDDYAVLETAGYSLSSFLNFVSNSLMTTTFVADPSMRSYSIKAISLLKGIISLFLDRCCGLLQNGLTRGEWAPRNVKVCMHCGLDFSLLRRQHHCRMCGRAVCSHCSRHRASYQVFGDHSRLCDSCIVICHGLEPVIAEFL